MTKRFPIAFFNILIFLTLALALVIASAQSSSKSPSREMTSVPCPANTICF